MDGSIHASAAQQGRVGCVDNGVRALLNNVPLHELKAGMIVDAVSRLCWHGLLVAERFHSGQLLAFQKLE